LRGNQQLIGYQAELRNFGMMLPFFYLATVDSLTLSYRVA